MTETNLTKLTNHFIKYHPSLLTWDTFMLSISQTNAITLDYIMLEFVRQHIPIQLCLSMEGLIIGDIFSSDPSKNALWSLAAPMSEQPTETIDFLIRTLNI